MLTLTEQQSIHHARVEILVAAYRVNMPSRLKQLHTSRNKKRPFSNLLIF